MEKIKVKQLLKALWIEINTLYMMDAINKKTFELLEFNIDEIEKEIDN